MQGVNLIKQMFSTNTVKKSGKNAKLNSNSFTDFMGKTTAQTNTDAKSNKSGTAVNGYGQYKYADKTIQVSDKGPDQMKADDVSKCSDGLKDELVSAVADDLQVSEDELLAAMESLGMVWTDLFNQQNLADISIELNISENPTELLLNPDFQNVLVDVNQLVTDAAADLGMNVDEFTDIVSQMTMVEPEDAAVLSSLVDDAVNSMTEVTDEDVVIDNSAVDFDAAGDTEQTGNEAYAINDSAASYSEDNMDGADGASDFEESGSDEGQFSDVEGHDAGLVVVQEADADALSGLNAEDIGAEQRPFMSEETTELINQIVDNIRLNVSQGTTSIEMQLNPENLGRVYVHLSAKEGTVNAQFTATNEVVKEALEAQAVTLRENLEQAGVKVDAVEVTVSSHEFERNLEQDQSREEQEGEYQETAAKQRRRNINMTSLDELAGVMTEEESLVAQIMKDNGNSVDMTV